MTWNSFAANTIRNWQWFRLTWIANVNKTPNVDSIRVFERKNIIEANNDLWQTRYHRRQSVANHKIIPAKRILSAIGLCSMHPHDKDFELFYYFFAFLSDRIDMLQSVRFRWCNPKWSSQKNACISIDFHWILWIHYVPSFRFTIYDIFFSRFFFNFELNLCASELKTRNQNVYGIMQCMNIRYTIERVNWNRRENSFWEFFHWKLFSDNRKMKLHFFVSWEIIAPLFICITSHERGKARVRDSETGRCERVKCQFKHNKK